MESKISVVLLINGKSGSGKTCILKNIEKYVLEKQFDFFPILIEPSTL